MLKMSYSTQNIVKRSVLDILKEYYYIILFCDSVHVHICKSINDMFLTLCIEMYENLRKNKFL